MNIVLTRLQNIGDMLTFIPALRTLRQALPQAKITVLAKHKGGLEVLKNCPYLDKVVVAPKSGAIFDKFRMRRELLEFGPIDYFVISPQDLGRVPWALFCRAKHISAYPSFVNYGEIRREKMVSFIDLPCIYDQSLTEIENCLRPVLNVLDDLGVPLPKDYSLALEFSWYTADDIAEARKLLRSYGREAGEDYVVMAPISKRSAKNWPKTRLIRLLRAMQEEWGVKIFLLGGTAEKRLWIAWRRKRRAFSRWPARPLSLRRPPSWRRAFSFSASIPARLSWPPLWVCRASCSTARRISTVGVRPSSPVSASTFSSLSPPVPAASRSARGKTLAWAPSATTKSGRPASVSTVRKKKKEN